MVVTSSLGHDLKTLLKICGALLMVTPGLTNAALNVVIIEGLAGDEKYSQQFDEQVTAIARASKTMTADNRIRIFRAAAVSRQAVLDYFMTLRSEITANDQIAVYLIGHGSYDEFEYKFNIAGPDLTGDDLASILNDLPSTNQLLINTSSASGAIADVLQNDNRTLILATRSGVERHATQFGNYFAAALGDSSADLDKNQVVSAAEAFRFAERQVDDHFERDGMLATEHPRMEGSRADRFGLARLGAMRLSSDDSELRELLASRTALNAQIDELRLSRDRMSAEDYQSELLQKMLELAQAEEAIEVRETELGIEN
jgi:hypothetical protein